MNVKQHPNRVASELSQWRLKEDRFEKLFSAGVLTGKPFLQEKLKFYDALQAKYGKTASEEERLALRILQQEKVQIEKHLYPNLLVRLLRRTILPLQQQQTAKRAVRQTAGNEQALKEAVLKAGFGTISNKLEQHIRQGQDAFAIPVSYYVNEKEKLDFTLSFAKDTSGQYQFEHYKAELRSEYIPEGNKQHSFAIERDDIISATGAYNLLAGRAVQKEYTGLEGKKETAWIQLDFNDKDASGNYRMKEFPPSYGYDLKEAIQQLPFKELQTVEGTEKLMNALKNGQQQAVRLEKGGQEQILFIVANPQFKSITIYDEHIKKISLAEALGNKTVEPVQQANKNSVQQGLGQARKNGLLL